MAETKPDSEIADDATTVEEPTDAAAETPVAGDLATEDPDALRAEIERLKAENQALAAEKPHHFWRTFLAVVCVVLGVVTLSMAVSAVWLNRTVMDENRWVETMAPLAADPAVQQYAATTASNAIFDNVDIQAYVNQALAPLPPQTHVLAAPITAAIQNAIKNAATKITQSQQFYNLWVQINRAAHKAFIAAITDQQGAVFQKQGGTVTMDVSALVDQIKQALVDQGLTFVGNINIPIRNQQITLVDSPAITQLGQVIQTLNTLAYVLPFLTIAFLAAGIGLAVNRQKAVLWIGVGVVLATIVPVQMIFLGQYPFAQAAYSLGKMPSQAAQDAYNIVFRNLITANRAIAVVGLVVWVGALIAGPSKWATSLRGGFQHGLSNVGPDWDFGVAGEWILAHSSGLRATGFILGFVLLFAIPGKTIWTLVWIVVLVIVWVALVAFFGRSRPAGLPQPAEKDAPLPAA